MKDIWHFPRVELTKRITTAIKYDVIHSFTLFAPRRIGKTYFLHYDLKPMLDSMGYKSLYFSFADQINNSLDEFKKVLISNIDFSVFNKFKIKEIKLAWTTIELNNSDVSSLSILQLISVLGHQAEKQQSKIILMLDEIQELVNISDAGSFIGELRTALDLNKNFVNVIFTGSSRDGLIKMFSNKKAPFFHFGANINLEPFGKEFTDFLAEVYKSITNTGLDKVALYDVFVKLNFITLSIRDFIAYCMMNPNNDLHFLFSGFQLEVFDKNNYIDRWKKLTTAEKAILLGIIFNLTGFYSESFRVFVNNSYGFDLTQGKTQNALNKLISDGDLHINDDGGYEIEDTFFKNWLFSNQSELALR